MKEILFRGKRVDNGQWVEGYVYDDKDYHIVKKYPDYMNSRKGLRRFFEVTPESIGQFTGLLDSQGHRIFEGDIVLFDDFEWVVYWDTEIFAWCFYCEQAGERVEFARAKEFIIKVAWNIHDNPELF